jgi:methanethiol S-methyltransferase
VRHPIYLGFIVAFWAAPAMSVGHLLFAAVTTAYIFVGIFLEERDLIDLFGDEYRRYRDRVSMLIPWRKGPQSFPVRNAHHTTPALELRDTSRARSGS